MKTKIGVLGSNGRMGQTIQRLVPEKFTDRAEIYSLADSGESLDSLFESDVVIDFSLPEGMVSFAELALSREQAIPPLVVGSTGWTLDQKKTLKELATKTPVLMGSNFSLGVMTLNHILRQASPILDRLGYTPVISEIHHKHKKDAPSGTAKSLQSAIAPEGPGNVQTHAIRAGEVIGDHEVTFFGDADQLSLGHHAQSRDIFASGAIEAALWLTTEAKSGKTYSKIITTEEFFSGLIA